MLRCRLQPGVGLRWVFHQVEQPIPVPGSQADHLFAFYNGLCLLQRGPAMTRRGSTPSAMSLPPRSFPRRWMLGAKRCLPTPAQVPTRQASTHEFWRNSWPSVEGRSRPGSSPHAWRQCCNASARCQPLPARVLLDDGERVAAGLPHCYFVCGYSVRTRLPTGLPVFLATQITRPMGRVACRSIRVATSRLNADESAAWAKELRIRQLWRSQLPMGGRRPKRAPGFHRAHFRYGHRYRNSCRRPARLRSGVRLRRKSAPTHLDKPCRY